MLDAAAVGHGEAPVAPDVRFVVGIGSSAGGLEALQELVAELAVGSGAAFVVAQHLSPEHHSVLDELLGRATVLPVVIAVDGQMLQVDAIAIAPPNHDVTVVATICV